MSMSGSVALISGGTSGIGAACVKDLLSQGATVAIIGRDKRKADQFLGELTDAHRVAVIAGDVASSQFCELAVQETVRKFGRLDFLINSAAVIRRASILETTDEMWLDTLGANVSGTFYLCRAAIRHMRTQGGGSIVNIASEWGLVGARGHAAYCASKGAVVNLSRALALDHARDNIRVNVICPGEVNTPMLRSNFEARGLDVTAGLKALGDTIPIGRVSEPAEQAECIRFLLSKAASYVTGAVFSSDGGSTAR